MAKQFRINLFVSAQIIYENKVDMPDENNLIYHIKLTENGQKMSYSRIRNSLDGVIEELKEHDLSELTSNIQPLIETFPLLADFNGSSIEIKKEYIRVVNSTPFYRIISKIEAETLCYKLEIKHVKLVDYSLPKQKEECN